MQNNNIEFTVFKNDTAIIVEEQHIKDYKTSTKSFEGHYIHSKTEVLAETKKVTFQKGDIYIPTQQNGVRYIIETLEAESTDSFFNWNFFDTILDQKEYFSSYVFEDIAEKLLQENPALKELLHQKMTADKDFSKSAEAQLDFVYKNSPYYESAHLKLPVYKVF
jgi:hypothetical protein